MSTTKHEWPRREAGEENSAHRERCYFAFTNILAQLKAAQAELEHLKLSQLSLLNDRNLYRDSCDKYEAARIGDRKEIKILLGHLQKIVGNHDKCCDPLDGQYCGCPSCIAYQTTAEWEAAHGKGGSTQ